MLVCASVAARVRVRLVGCAVVLRVLVGGVEVVCGETLSVASKIKSRIETNEVKVIVLHITQVTFCLIFSSL